MILLQDFRHDWVGLDELLDLQVESFVFSHYAEAAAKG